MSKDFVVLSGSGIVHENDSLAAASVVAGDTPGAAVYERVQTEAADLHMGRMEAEAEAVRRSSRDFRRSLGVFVLEIPVDWTFKPRTADATPPSKASGLPIGELGRFAIAINSGEWSVHKRVWAAVTDNGGLLLLPCKPEDRPSDPTAFLPGTRVMEKDEAKSQAVEENRDRLVVSHVPRTWSVTLRPLTAFVE